MVFMSVFLCTHLQAGLISSFQAGDGDWQLGTLTVGNVDSTPDLEIIVPYRNSSGQWFLDAFKWNGTRLPGFPWSDGSNSVINTSPTLYDLNGDGINEIIFTCGTQGDRDERQRDHLVVEFGEPARITFRRADFRW